MTDQSPTSPKRSLSKLSFMRPSASPGKRGNVLPPLSGKRPKFTKPVSIDTRAAAPAEVDDEPGDSAVRELLARADALDVVVEVNDGRSKKRPAKRDEVRVAPEARYSDASMRCVFTDASILSTTLLRMGTMGNDIVLDFAPTSSEAGLSVRQVDKTGVLMAELSMPRQAFLLYDVPDAVCAPLFYEQVNGFAKACSHDHTLSFTATPSHRDRLCARMHSKRVDRTRIFDLRDASSIVPVPKLPYTEWPYPVCVTMPASDFFDEIKVALDNKGAACILNVGRLNCPDTEPENAMCFASITEGGNDTVSYETVVEVTRIERRATALTEQHFDLDFLRLASGFKGVAATVQVHFGLADQPLWLHFIMIPAMDQHPETCVDVIVAPRV